MQEARSEMKEAQHDLAARGERKPNAWREVARVKRHDADGLWQTIPAERQPEHAGAASKRR